MCNILTVLTFLFLVVLFIFSLLKTCFSINAINRISSRHIWLLSDNVDISDVYDSIYLSFYSAYNIYSDWCIVVSL